MHTSPYLAHDMHVTEIAKWQILYTLLLLFLFNCFNLLFRRGRAFNGRWWARCGPACSERRQGMTRQANGGAHNGAMTSRNGAMTWRTNAMMAFDSGEGDLLGAVRGPVVHSCHTLRGFEVCLWANNF